MGGEKIRLLMFSFALVWLFQFGISIAGSLTGNTGLVTIPTAEMLEDREIRLGLNWLDKKYVPYAAGKRNVIVPYFTTGYLPLLEVSLRLTRLATRHLPRSHAGIGDRMASVRLRLYNESEFFPSVVLGVHDPFGNSHFYSSYLVTSKRFQAAYTAMSFHLGYGIDRDEAKGSQFVGAFGGVSLSPMRHLNLMLEYDSEKLNCGASISLLGHLDLLLALLNFDTFSAGVSYRFRVR